MRALMQCFKNLVNLTIESNPINECRYLRQFSMYRFSNLRFFNKSVINYEDQQKAKQIFSNFDNILNIPGQLVVKKKDGSVPSQPKNVTQLSKSMAESILNNGMLVKRAKSEFDKVWTELCQDFIS